MALTFVIGMNRTGWGQERDKGLASEADLITTSSSPWPLKTSNSCWQSSLRPDHQSPDPPGQTKNGPDRIMLNHQISGVCESERSPGTVMTQVAIIEPPVKRGLAQIFAARTACSSG